MWNTRVGMDDEKGVCVGFRGTASGDPATRRDATRARASVGARARERPSERAKTSTGTMTVATRAKAAARAVDDAPERKRSLGTRMLREFAREDVRAL